MAATFPTCDICKRFPTNPVNSGCCSRLYCWNCLISNTGRSCACDVFLNPETSVSVPVHGLLKCPNYATCTCLNAALGVTIFTPADLETHLATRCPHADKRAIKCINAGCEARMPMKDMENHLKVCFFKIMLCPNNCSAELMTKAKLLLHLESECPDRLVPCKYAKYGCTEMLRPLELEKHLETQALKHNDLLEKKLAQLEANPACKAVCKTKRICDKLNANPVVKQVVTDINSEFRRFEQWIQGKLSVVVILKLLLCLFVVHLIPFLKIPVFVISAVRVYKKVRNPALASQSQLVLMLLYIAVAFFVGTAFIRL